MLGDRTCHTIRQPDQLPPPCVLVPDGLINNAPLIYFRPLIMVECAKITRCLYQTLRGLKECHPNRCRSHTVRGCDGFTLYSMTCSVPSPPLLHSLLCVMDTTPRPHRNRTGQAIARQRLNRCTDTNRGEKVDSLTSHNRTVPGYSVGRVFI